MPFEFIFEPADKTDWASLRQGDVLVRDERLRAALAEAHTYYATAPEYTHFMVLTQSCDLVRRGGKKPKSRYITLAAIRPLTTVVDRIIARYRFSETDFPFPICSKEMEVLAKQIIERIIHNTEGDYFFLRKKSHENIADDYCVFLALSVALRASHYDACLGAKIAQLAEIFQAKVGWLTGNLYSRVGTPDLEEVDGPEAAETFKESFMDEVVYRRTAWLTPAQLRSLKELIRTWRRENPGTVLDEEIARTLLGRVPEQLDIIAERAVAQLATKELILKDAGIIERAVNVLRNDPAFRKLVERS